MGPTVIHLAFFKERLIKEEKVDFQFKGLATAKVHVSPLISNFINSYLFSNNLRDILLYGMANLLRFLKCL